MKQAPHLMFDLAERLPRLRMYDGLKPVLMSITFLCDESMFVQKRMRPREIGDVDRNVMTIIGRNLVRRLSEEKALIPSYTHLRHRPFFAARHRGRRLHHLLIELRDARRRTRLHTDIDIRQAYHHIAQLLPVRLIPAEETTPRTGDLYISLLGRPRKFRAL